MGAGDRPGWRETLPWLVGTFVLMVVLLVVMSMYVSTQRASDRCDAQRWEVCR